MSKLDKHSARQTPTIPLNVFRRASRLLWEELFLLGVASYIWMLLGFFIVLLPPLTVGLMYMANQVARGNAIGFTMLFSGARRFLGRSYIWGAINAFAIVLVLADLSYYQQLQGDLGIVAVTLAILLALAWGVVPTSPAIHGQTVDSLAAHLDKRLDDLAARGIDKRLLADKAILTPACGTGTMEPADAEKAFELVAALSRAMREKYKL